MSVPVIAFFSNKGGVGKTSLVYHLSWMFSDLGRRVLAADLDPQANLTAAFLDEDELEALWAEPHSVRTVFDAVQPIISGAGDILIPEQRVVNDNLTLLPGDLRLSSFEDELAAGWPGCLDGKERAFRVVSALWRLMQGLAERVHAQIVLMDLGPSLGAINRACLVSADHVVIPLSPDLFALQGLRNLGPTLRRWREEWQQRLQARPTTLQFDLPQGGMRPVGYVVLPHAIRLDRPVRAYQKWMNRIPIDYREHVVGEGATMDLALENDPHLLALLRHYRSLMPMAQEARKPIFHLRAADGAIGAHLEAVAGVRRDFGQLAARIARAAGIPD